MQIDYDALAETYDQHRSGGGPYLNALVSAARVCNARRVLEIGPGTGNTTSAFRGAYPCTLLGLESSRGMLIKARTKALPVVWLQGCAPHVPLKAASIDFLFACYVIHHIRDLDALMRECARVLKSGGGAAFVTASGDFIERHPMNRYFPSFAKVDKARFQPVEEVAAALRRAGFQTAEVECVTADPVPIDQRYVEKVASKFISTYALLSEEEFSGGLARLRNDVSRKGRLDIGMAWESAIVRGRR